MPSPVSALVRQRLNLVGRFSSADVTTIADDEQPTASGLPTAATDAIWNSVRAWYATRLLPSVTICLRHRGQTILHRSIGHERGNAPTSPNDALRVSAQPGSLYNMFSASKAVTAMLIHHLDDRGLLHVDDRVADYIPAFAKHGKGRVTIRHVIAHRGGLPTVRDVPMNPSLLADDGAILQLLCDAKAESQPGRRLAYHAVTGGFLLGEIIRRVTGMPIRDYLDETVRRPLGFDSFQYGVPHAELPRVAEDAWTGPNPPLPIARMVKRGFGVTMPEAVDLANHPTFLTGVVPSGNIVTTADEACRFMEMLRREGELDGVRVFEPRTVRRAVGETSYMEVDDILKLPIRYGMGFMLGDKLLSLFSPGTPMAFGHLGFTRILIWADPERELSCAILSNGKPLIAQDLPLWLNVPRTIASRLPRVRHAG